MTRRSFELLGALALIVVAVFPWRSLQDHTHWEKVAWIPFVSPPIRLRDIVINAILFVPLGSAMRAQVLSNPFVLPACSALVISLLAELSQLYSHTRFPSATDVTMNVFGAVAGAWLRDRRLRKARH
jgi:glycopeptide antibiotics resistance protein